jgi:chromosome segregation ATPase
MRCSNGSGLESAAIGGKGAQVSELRTDSHYRQKLEEERERTAELEQEIEDLKMDLGWAKRDLVWFREQCNKLLLALENKIEPERSLQEIQTNESSYAAAVALLQSAKRGLSQAGGVLRHGSHAREDRIAQLEREITDKESLLEGARTELSKLRGQLSTLVAERDAARQEATRLQDQCRDLQRQLTESSGQRDAESSRAHAEHAFFEQRLREVSNQYACLYQSYASLYHQYMTLSYPGAGTHHAPPPPAYPQQRPYGWPAPPPPPPPAATVDWWPAPPPKP